MRISLSESFECIDNTIKQLHRSRSKVTDAVRAKVDTVLKESPGYG